jgi:hypothetical protein
VNVTFLSTGEFTTKQLRVKEWKSGNGFRQSCLYVDAGGGSAGTGGGLVVTAVVVVLVLMVVV